MAIMRSQLKNERVKNALPHRDLNHGPLVVHRDHLVFLERVSFIELLVTFNPYKISTSKQVFIESVRPGLQNVTGNATSRGRHRH